MLKLILGGFVSLVTMVATFYLLSVALGNPWWGKGPDHYPEGTCLKMSFPSVESWHGNLTARVERIGKQNYEVKYWMEYGWTNLTDTWPFSLETVKVGCPMEVQDHESR